jgi:CysZ protein
MIFKSIILTLKSLFSPSILLIFFLPFFAATFLLITVLFFSWEIWIKTLSESSIYLTLISYLGDGTLLGILNFILVGLATLLVFGPIWYLVYVFIISVFIFPLLLPKIKKSDYPDLVDLKGGTVVGSVKNTIIASIIFFAAYIITLPLWLLTPLSPLIHLGLTAFLNKKVFSYDVLQDYASNEEREQILKNNNSELWLAGLLTALLSYIPFLNIFAPPITALYFIHYLLSVLKVRRS